MARRKKREPLSREAIVDAALDLIDRDGIASFSTRKLGTELGVEAMSLYHHFPSKGHLLDACVDRVLQMVIIPDRGDPYERLRKSAVAYRAAAHAHPGIAPFIATHRLNTEGGLAWLNAFIAMIRECGFDAGMTARVFRVFGYFMMGCAIDETSGYARGPSAAEPLPPEEERKRFPEVAAVGPYFQREYWDGHFTFGLDALIEMIRGAPRTLPGA
jgi:AcrR family transcriptional regulator